eukprot:gnl/MRDRNA2_/MRDRNA2_100743_c0_seq1.p1 gnl/MRDRNA2_/MRDRNA2_100743_c0~~gnl/MRDRNA2_/MRDRNA2_100743_c0_seq1.p1  ORF type:complete len:681 (+),score=110.15 gnl/MRDRNA2_/MRDRNA2_100743_c0_seq1:91-2133(+)
MMPFTASSSLQHSRTGSSEQSQMYSQDVTNEQRPSMKADELQGVLDRIQLLEQENEKISQGIILKATERLLQAEKENQMLKASQRLWEAEEENEKLKAAHLDFNRDLMLTNHKVTESQKLQRAYQEAVHESTTADSSTATSSQFHVSKEGRERALSREDEVTLYKEDEISKIEKLYADMRSSFIKLQSNYTGAMQHIVREDSCPEKTQPAVSSSQTGAATNLLGSSATPAGSGIELQQLLDTVDARLFEAKTSSPNKSKEQVAQSPPTVHKLQALHLSREDSGKQPDATRAPANPAGPRESAYLSGNQFNLPETHLPQAEIWTMEDCRQSKSNQGATGQQGPPHNGGNATGQQGPRVSERAAEGPAIQHLTTKSSSYEPTSDVCRTPPVQVVQKDVSTQPILEGTWKCAHRGVIMGTIVGNVFFSGDGSARMLCMIGDIIHMQEVPGAPELPSHGFLQDGLLHWSDGSVWKKCASELPLLSHVQSAPKLHTSITTNLSSGQMSPRTPQDYSIQPTPLHVKPVRTGSCAALAPISAGRGQPSLGRPPSYIPTGASPFSNHVTHHCHVRMSSLPRSQPGRLSYQQAGHASPRPGCVSPILLRNPSSPASSPVFAPAVPGRRENIAQPAAPRQDLQVRTRMAMPDRSSPPHRVSASVSGADALASEAKSAEPAPVCVWMPSKT